jgi:uncharacterized protein (DUF1778 family)
MATSEAQIKAIRKYESKAYDKILLRIRKDTEPTRETITKAAEACGLSLNGFILEAIKEKIGKTE